MKTLCILLLLLTGVAGDVAAQDGRRATVRLDGRAVLQIGAAGSVGAVARARAIEKRLGAILDETARPGRATLQTEADSVRTVIVDGVAIVRVHRADARRETTSLDITATRWATAIDAALAEAADRRSSTSGRFRSTIAGTTRTAFARVIESALYNVPRFLAAILVLLVFWTLAHASRRLLRWFFRHTIDDLTVENLLRQMVYAGVWVLGIIVAIGALGWDASAVATGLGLTGLALGFALKDILSNFVSGLLLLTLRPFRVGDQIIVGETEGTVKRIELRATHILTYDGRIALVPNAELFTSRVINNTATPIRRGAVPFRVGYRESLDHVVPAALAAIRAAEGVLAEPSPNVQLRDLGDDMYLEARFWADSRRSDFQETAARVRTELVRSLKRAGIGLPDPDLRRIVALDGDVGLPVAGDSRSTD